jgi:hypothetical protein
MVATASGSSIGAAFAAAAGTGISFFGSGLGIAVLAMIAAFVVVSLIHAYHQSTQANLPVSLQTPDRLDALKQNLIRSVLLFCQPFKGFVAKQTSNQGIDDVLQGKYE